MLNTKIVKPIELIKAKDGKIYSGKFKADNKLYYAAIRSPFCSCEFCAEIDEKGNIIRDVEPECHGGKLTAFEKKVSS